MSSIGDVTHTKFESWKARLKNISLPIRIEDNMNYQQYIIKHYYKPKSAFAFCQKENRYSVLPEFAQAYKSLCIQEQVDYYSSVAEFLILCNDRTNQQIAQYIEQLATNLEGNVVAFSAQYCTRSLFKTWVECEVKLLVDKNSLVILAKNEKVYELSCYLVHRDQDKHVLELIPCQPDHSKGKIKILPWQLRFNAYQQIKSLVTKAMLNYMSLIIEDYRKFKIVPMVEEISSLRLIRSPSSMSEISSILKIDRSPEMNNNDSPFALKLHIPQTQKKNTIEELDQSLCRTQKLDISGDEILKTLNMMDDSLDTIKQQITNGYINKFLYEIQNIQNLGNYDKIMQYRSCFLYQNHVDPSIFKYIFQFSSTPQKIVVCLLEVSKFQRWNKCIKAAEIKTRLSSQNSMIINQQHFPTSKFSRSRDFAYSRHLFKNNMAYYFVDNPTNQFQNPDTIMIIRTDFQYAVWRIQSKDMGCRIIFQIKFNKEMPSITHMKNYFEGYYGLEEYLLTQSINHFQTYLSLDWQIKLDIKNENTSSFYSVQSFSQSQKFYQISQKSKILTNTLENSL